MPRIALCMMVRDEERFLPDCLASVRGIVDETVIVDTGSRDRTREIAVAAGARVLDLPWGDDFSAPRNLAVREAAADWILQLDADERLAPGAGAVLRRAVRGARFDAGLLPLHDAADLHAPVRDVLAGRARIGNPMSLPRLLRNAGGLAYRGIVHESVEEWFLRRRGVAVHLDAPIVHLGAVPSLRAARGKRERNVALLRRRCEATPDDVTAYGYLAGELLEDGDADGAWAAADAGWAVVQRQPAWRSVLRLAVARARLALRRGDPASALETVSLGERRQGATLDFAFLRGCAHELESRQAPGAEHRRAAASAAAEAYREALAHLARPAVERLCGEDAASIEIRRGDALLVAGRPAEALAAFEAALRAHPAARAAVVGAAEAALDLGMPAEALRRVEPALGADADGWIVASAAARAVGAEADAEVLLRCARERLGAEGVAPHRRVRFPDLIAGTAPVAVTAGPAPDGIASADRRSTPALVRRRERFAVTVVSPPGYVHAAALREVAETLLHAFRALGHEAELGTDPGASGRRHVVLGAHLLARTRERLRDGSILYNLEQVQEGSPWLTPELLDLYRRFPLWDYSAANADGLVRVGLPRPTVVPIGWMPQLARIEPRAEDIDVLFYGSVNERRRAVLSALERRGARVHVAFGAYGAERDALIARSKLVLNVHYYQAKVFEIVRVSYLLGNGRAVVSERGRDPGEELEFEDAVAFAPYEGLVERCLGLLADDRERRRRAGAGPEVMRRRPATAYLAAALGLPDPRTRPEHP